MSNPRGGVQRIYKPVRYSFKRTPIYNSEGKVEKYIAKQKYIKSNGDHVEYTVEFKNPKPEDYKTLKSSRQRLKYGKVYLRKRIQSIDDPMLIEKIDQYMNSLLSQIVRVKPTKTSIKIIPTEEYEEDTSIRTMSINGEEKRMDKKIKKTVI